jgi:CheY-like chemotaxis protein
MPAVGPCAPPTVLLVEDHDDTREVAERILQRHGYVVHSFTDPTRALTLASTVRCDVALIDIGLPQMDGIEVWKRLRAIQAMRGAAFTAYVMEKDLADYRAAGFDEVVAKPIAIDELLAVLRRLVPSATPVDLSAEDAGDVDVAVRS